jgi:hypothetical protein
LLSRRANTNPGKRIQHRAASTGFWFIFIALVMASGQPRIATGEKHTGVKMECFAIQIAPRSISVLDGKGQEHTILTDRDYTTLITKGAHVTLWYSKQGGVLHLEDIDLPKESLFLTEDDIRRAVQHILILPTTKDVENSQGIIDAIAEYFRDTAGWSVAPAEQGAKIEKNIKSSESNLDAITPQSSQADQQRLMEAQGNMAAKIAAEARVDAVLEINVEKVKAQVKKGVAKWDDMTELISASKTRALGAVTGLGGNGWVYAATVNLNLWSRNGKLLWNRRRGFAALGYQVGVGFQYRARPLTEVYADQAAVQQWLAITLGRFAPPDKSQPPLGVTRKN